MDGLQQVVDRFEVTDVVSRLGALLDGHGGDPAEVYDVDIVGRGPRGEFHGRDEVVRRTAVVPGSTERYQHLHTDLLVEVDGDVAVVAANQLVQFFEPGQAPHRSSGLRVGYRLVRRPEGWRIARVDVALEWIIGDLPA